MAARKSVRPSSEARTGRPIRATRHVRIKSNDALAPVTRFRQRLPPPRRSRLAGCRDRDRTWRPTCCNGTPITRRTMSESSRIIVKNLPKYMTQDRLRDHFAEKGTITDVKLVKTATGVFRRFAYIGFKSDKEAKAAVKHFHNTYVDTAKIHVEIAKRIGDPNLPRAWSRYTKGTSAFERANGASDATTSPAAPTAPATDAEPASASADAVKDAKQSFIDSLYLEEQQRASLQTYLEVMKPRTTKTTWANDDGTEARLETTTKVTKKKKKGEDVKVEVQAVPNRKPGGQGMLVTRSHVTFAGSDDEDSDDEYQTLPARGSAAADKVAIDDEDEDVEMGESETGSGEEEDEANGSVADDDDGAVENDDDVKSTETSNADDVDAASLAPATTAAAPPRPTHRVVPLTDADTAADEALIAETGRLYVVNVPYSASDKDLIQVFSPFGALSAVHVPLHRESKQPKGIAFVHFVQPQDALAAYRGVQNRFFQGRVLVVRGAKAERKDDSEADAAGSFKAKRQAQLKAKAGSDFNWNSLYMASDAVAGAMAAKLGVGKADILDRDADNMAVRLALAETHVISETKTYLAEHGIVLDAFHRKLRSDSVLLVKNIAHGTTEAEIEELFAKYGELGRIVVPPAGTVAIVEYLTNNDAKNAFRHLAYKRFKSLPLYLEWAPQNCFEVAYDPAKHARGSAAAAVAAATPSDAAPAPSSAAPAAPADKKKKGKRVSAAAFLGDDSVDLSKVQGAADTGNTKLMVRNVPFEATIKDLRQLFASFAHVKSVRLPKKVTGGHRGFAFAEFLTHNEAVEALQALRHTHLYGRRLVIEFAKAGESVEELRDRTKQVTGAANKRRRVDMEGKYTERASDDDEDDE
ncbi:hypothetical protein AMAG_01430 [Allomyces macrogynus ATCC 38327]|uniref:RRM domain-containing protein n=1 Tax=Allomyces macrogynus (strain ATCC 38327) TaxID=578462 RepID=A0A0L0RZN4_ALLM3|nr:hypothetical protein AMAG_01430 [Allomyces macrogynus ATCC 38327]|eukprot:KNE55541.1 hypothetical protein AMAG_01430 [Allomyces macrogynus ATCC 38327]